MQGRSATATKEKFRDKIKKSKKDKKRDKKEDRKREEKEYDKRRGSRDRSPDDFDDYIDDYNLRSKGAGSGKDPKASRFSGLDVREMFEAGRDKFGESKRDAARAVLDYADDMDGRTRMGGGTEKALDRLRRYLKNDNDDDDDGRPSLQEQADEAQERLNETDLTRPGNETPRLDKYNSDDPMMDAISGGDDLVQHYDQKFVPHLHAEADHGIKSIGSTFSHFMDEFVYGPPQLGSVQPIFDKYKDEIDDAVDDAKDDKKKKK